MTVTDYADEVAVIVAVRKARQPKDADGDGWIDEGKPTERFIGIGTAQARSALRRGAKAVKPAPKKVAPKKAPAKRAAKAVVKPVPKKRATPERATTLQRGVDPAKDKNNPLFAPLFKPVKLGTKKDYDTFKRIHDKRVAEQKKVGPMKAGGKTHFRRFLPVEHGKVAQPIAPPGGKYIAGGGMELNEPGVIGETLIQYNPTINKLVSDYFHAPLSESEGMSSKHGRVPNSIFDFYAGGYGVEVKTIAVTGSHGTYKVPHMAEKLEAARKRGIKPAVVFMMVDQKSGRVWLFAAKDMKLHASGNQGYKGMDMIGPSDGIPIGQDAMYSAWLYGHVERPLREGGDGNSVKGNGASVTITGKPSKTRYGSESRKKTVEQMLSEPAIGTFR